MKLIIEKIIIKENYWNIIIIYIIKKKNRQIIYDSEKDNIFLLK